MAKIFNKAGLIVSGEYSAIIADGRIVVGSSVTPGIECSEPKMIDAVCCVDITKVIDANITPDSIVLLTHSAVIKISDDGSSLITVLILPDDRVMLSPDNERFLTINAAGVNLRRHGMSIMDNDYIEVKDDHEVVGCRKYGVITVFEDKVHNNTPPNGTVVLCTIPELLTTNSPVLVGSSTITVDGRIYGLTTGKLHK